MVEVVEVPENTSYADLGDKKYASFAEIKNEKRSLRSMEPDA